jgi:Ser/Thr protein kinase RdoA (MazF antagonist)
VRADFKSCLPDRDLDHYLRLLRDSRAILLRHLDAGALPFEDAAVFRTISTHLDELESLWDELVKICAVMPRTLVHGDFVIKNLRVRESSKGPALLVFDWEFTGWGIPAADLTQFIDLAASPDLGRYCSILNREHSYLDLREIQAVAACGNLLRLVDQMSWATAGHEFVLPAQLVRATSLLQFYEPSIRGALSAFQRSYA